MLIQTFVYTALFISLSCLHKMYWPSPHLLLLVVTPVLVVAVTELNPAVCKVGQDLNFEIRTLTCVTQPGIDNEFDSTMYDSVTKLVLDDITLDSFLTVYGDNLNVVEVKGGSVLCSQIRAPTRVKVTFGHHICVSYVHDFLTV